MLYEISAGQHHSTIGITLDDYINKFLYIFIKRSIVFFFLDKINFLTTLTYEEGDRIQM